MDTMFQTVKAITIAGVLATSLPLLTGTANALTPNNWNSIMPYSCQSSSLNHNGVTDTLVSITFWEGAWRTMYVFGSQVTGNVLNHCMSGTPFVAYYNPDFPYYFTTFYFALSPPGYQYSTVYPGWNAVRPLYCETAQPLDNTGVPLPTTSLWVVNQAYTFGVVNSRVIGGIANFCETRVDGIYNAIAGFNNNGLYWNVFEF
jgi:hypothetical protein